MAVTQVVSGFDSLDIGAVWGDRILLVDQSSTGYDIENLRAVMRLVTLLRGTSVSFVCLVDERLVAPFSRAMPSVHFIPHKERTGPTDEEILEVAMGYGVTRVDRFERLPEIIQRLYGIPLTAAQRLRSSNIAYIPCARDLVDRYLTQLDAASREVRARFGEEVRLMPVVSCYDKPKSDAGSNAALQELEGKRQSLLVEDIAEVVGDAQVILRSEGVPVMPVVYSFQYGDPTSTHSAAFAASTGMIESIRFFDDLDLNRDFDAQLAALLAVDEFSKKTGSRSVTLGNASTYLHCAAAAAGWFDRHLIGLHGYPSQPGVRDGRPQWLELPRYLGAQRVMVFQQVTPGDWTPVKEKMLHALVETARECG